MAEHGDKGQAKTLRVVVRGGVQMVGFRQFVWVKARSLGLSGYVRNGGDGRSVEVVAEGPVAVLEELLRDLEQGPSMARVEDVQVAWSEETGRFDEFEVRF